MLKKEQIEALILQIYETCPGNVITEQDAISPAQLGLKLFEAPLVGIGSANDILFLKFKEKGVIGPWFMRPPKWLPGAETVVSMFFPFTEEVKSANRACTDGPSPEWLHGRIEGQAFLRNFSIMLKDSLTQSGMAACAPSADERFCSVMRGNAFQDMPGVDEQTFGSNWSERHAAFVCGLGTFGLSKGLITSKGIAGRFASVIIDQKMEPDERPYTDIYEYCTKCGACVRRCPVQAISIEKGKDHIPCHGMMLKSKELYDPRLGCGLCQTKVPCESGIPKKR